MNDETAVQNDEAPVQRCRPSTFWDHVHDFFWSVAGRTIGGLLLLTAWTALVASGALDSLVQLLRGYLGI